MPKLRHLEHLLVAVLHLFFDSIKAMTRTIYVDSRDRISGTPSNFTIQLRRTLDTTDRKHRMRVDLLRLPLTIPTIRATNNTMTFDLEGSVVTITIPSRQYDANSLPQTIQALLTASTTGRTWTVNYDVTTVSMTISCSQPFTVTGGSFATQLMSRPYTTTFNSIRFSYVPLNGVDVIFLCSDQFASVDIHGPNGSHDILLPCNITSPFGSVQEFSYPVPDYIDCPAFATNTLSFTLRDRNHDLLTDYLQNVSFLLTID